MAKKLAGQTFVVTGTLAGYSRADREVVLAAVKNYGAALEHAAAPLQADREVVLAAVKQDGWVLEYASKKLQQDEELKKIAEG